MSHITDVPVANVLSLSDKDVEKLSRSQFSLSVGGIPTFRKPTPPPRNVLRVKLLLVTTIFNTKRDKIRQADEFERKATDFEGFHERCLTWFPYQAQA